MGPDPKMADVFIKREIWTQIQICLEMVDWNDLKLRRAKESSFPYRFQREHGPVDISISDF